jgi:hypothetical protein
VKIVSSDANTTTLTFSSAQAGTATILHAGSVALATNQPNAVLQNPSATQTIGGPGLTITAPTAVTGPLNSNNLVAGNVANKPAISDSVLYVSVNGSDANDGLSWGSAKATIAAAVAALPTKTVTDAYFLPITGAYGTVYVGSGTFSFSSGATIASPFVNIIGQGMIATVLRYTGSGTAIWLNPNSNMNEFVSGNSLFELTIDGIAAGAGAIGLRTTDFSGFGLRNVGIRNFTGAGSIGWLDDTINWYNEKMSVHHLSLENNTVSWKISPAVTSAGYPNTTYGYSYFDVTIMNLSGQTGLLMTNGALTYSLVHLTINQVSTPANATAIQLQNSASFYDNTVAIHIESPAGLGTGAELNIASGAFFASGVGVWDQGAPSSNVGTSYTGPLAYTAPLTTQVVASTDVQGNTTYATGFVATSGANQNSPSLNLTGNYWTGSASAKDTWRFSDFLGGGANPQSFLFLNHVSGSSGSTSVMVPQLAIGSSPTLPNTIIKIPGGQADFPTLTLPDLTAPLTATIASGTAALPTAAIASATCSSVVTVAATGALTTDAMSGITFNGDPTAITGYAPTATGSLKIYQWPTANNVNFKVCNDTNASITPGAATLIFRVPR